VTRPSPEPSEEQPLWTVEEACAYFTESGLPITPDRLRMIIRGLEWKPAGTRKPPPGSKGGRGESLYPMADMMILWSRLSEWLAQRGIRRREPAGRGDTPAGLPRSA
jgi:hypothetical protein